MVNIKEIPDPKINHIWKDVYTPSDDSYLLIDYLKENIKDNNFDGISIENIKNILDIGTGSGIITLFLRSVKQEIPKFSPELFASDVNENALKCAKLNEKDNFENPSINFIKSDIFKSFPDHLRGKFDLIIFNPPYLPSLEKKGSSQGTHGEESNRDITWDGGEEGLAVILSFFDQAESFLNVNNPSYIYFITSSRSNLKRLGIILDSKGYKNSILDKKRVFFEDIYLNRLEIINFP